MDLGRSMFKDLASVASTAASNVRGSTTKELLQQIEKQNDELLKYKKRTRDLVVSYKTIIDEKNKLQSTLETLTSGGGLPKSSERAKVSKKKSDEGGDPSLKRKVKSSKKTEKIRKAHLKAESFPLPNSRNTSEDADFESQECLPTSQRTCDGETSDESNSESDGDTDEADSGSASEEEAGQVNNTQLMALTSQLTQAMTSNEKQKQTFLKDKQIVKQEYESKIVKLQNELKAANENFKNTNEQLTIIKETLRIKESDIEKETDQHNKFRRDTQKQIISFKKQISDLEQAYEKEKSQNLEAASKNYKNESEHFIKDEMLDRYKIELDDYKERLAFAQEKLATPDEKMVAKIAHLESDLEYRKQDYSEKLSYHNDNKSRLESRLKEVEKYNEAKRKDLESQINELSVTIGASEKSKNKDLELINQLRERINVLDLENLNLLSKAKSHKELTTEELPALMYEVVSRDRNISNIFTALLVSSRKAVNDEVSLTSLTQIFPEIKTVYEKQLQSLKEENQNLTIELTTLQMTSEAGKNSPKPSHASAFLHKQSSTSSNMSSSQNNNSLTNSTNNEEQLRLHNLNLIAKVDDLQASVKSNNLNHKNLISNLNLEFQQKLKESDAQWRLKLSDLENEIINHRERSLKTLGDKDRELNQLRAQIFTTPPTTPDHMTMSLSQVSITDELSEKYDNNSHMINYSEKLARKDIELENLKKQNKEFSKRIRLLQDKILEVDDKHERDILQYKDRIATAINPTSRSVSNSSDTRNEDYVKNVLFNYLIMPQKSPGKTHMLSALAAALHFTSEELNKVKSVQKLK